MAATSTTKFAANLKWLFADLPLERQLSAVATEGFTGVEIPAPYDQPPAKWRTVLADVGLDVVLINTPLGPPGSSEAGGLACLPDRVPEFERGIEQALEYASHMSCSLVHVVGGRRPPGLTRVRAQAQYIRNITWAAEKARAAGVRLVLEMQNQRSAPRFVLESQAQAAAVAEAVGDPVGVLFDVFHTQVAGGDVVRTFEQVRSLVDHIQIGDAPERSEPGTGEMAWPFVIEEILSSGYGGWFGFEFTPNAGSPGVFKRVSEVINRVAP